MSSPSAEAASGAGQGVEPRAGDQAAVISLQGVCKSYRAQLAVDQLDLVVQAGELISILGPNGAGKTTSIEMMEGYRRPDRGTVRVLGLDPARDARRLRPRVGLMLQEGGLYPTLKVSESLQLFASFFANPLEPKALLEQVGLSAKANSRFRQLSGGEKQRLSLALALVGRPQLVFLDEPTAGMDPRARILTWEIVEEARKGGCTVVLTTHSMEEAERLSDRVAILSQGRLVAYDSPAGLRRESPGGSLELELELELDSELQRRLRELPSVGALTSLGRGKYEVGSDQPRQAMAEITQLLQDQGPPITLLRSGRGSLEQVFLQLTEQRPQ